MFSKIIPDEDKSVQSQSIVSETGQVDHIAPKKTE